MSAFRWENNQLRCKMTQHNVSLVCGSCDSRVHLYLFLGKHTGFQILTGALFCGSNGRSSLGCSGSRAGTAGPWRPLLGRAGSPSAPRPNQQVRRRFGIIPATRPGKCYHPVWLATRKKRRGSGQRASFSICQSLKVHSVYIACFSQFHFIVWPAEHFKSKTNTSFILFWLHSRCSYSIAKYVICVCACMCTWTLTYCRIFASHFTLFNLVCWRWPENL